MAEAAKYESDEDGYVREIVGPWVLDKHNRLSRYIGISRSVRAKFTGATFIDLYSGPGRLRISSETQAIHGSPLVAWHEAVASGAAFTEVHVADADPEISEAVGARLRKHRAAVFVETGPADQTVDRVIAKLDPYALHFAFLDPYNLRALPFEVIHKLAKLKRMDILIHISVQDLQRNLRRYIYGKNSPLDIFAPGWRGHVDVSRSDELIRAKYLEYWRGLLKTVGMATTETAALVVGSKNQRLYLLAFAARHARALEFWEKIRSADGKQQPLLL
jgi:three-Cys-motif partner protein